MTDAIPAFTCPSDGTLLEPVAHLLSCPSCNRAFTTEGKALPQCDDTAHTPVADGAERFLAELPTPVQARRLVDAVLVHDRFYGAVERCISTMDFVLHRTPDPVLHAAHRELTLAYAAWHEDCEASDV